MCTWTLKNLQKIMHYSFRTVTNHFVVDVTAADKECCGEQARRTKLYCQLVAQAVLYITLDSDSLVPNLAIPFTE